MGIYTLPSQNAMQTTLGGNLALGETGSLTLAADWSSYLSTASSSRPFVIVIDRVNASGTKTPTVREYIKCTGISGTTVSGLTRGRYGSTAQAHTAGAIVELVMDAETLQSIIDGFDVEHTPSDGTHDATKVGMLAGTQTFTGDKTFSGAVVLSGAVSGAGISAIASTDGWIAGTGSWTYSSADDPTFVIATSVDQTSLIGVGDRIKLTQTTAKYFIVTAIDASTITVYGGTDYDLANAAITSPYFSHMKAPLGFPTSVAKWTHSATDTSDRTQSTPSQATWYNLGSFSISIPIGVWQVSYCVHVRATEGTAAACTMQTALSTANNTASDNGLVTYSVINVSTVGDFVASRSKTLTLAAKTAYYLNTNTGANGIDSIANLNSTAFPAKIDAICAYL